MNHIKIENGLHEKAEGHWRAPWVVGAAKSDEGTACCIALS